MISYERIDCSEGIDLDRGDKSVKCMICNYWYFGHVFKYQPLVCNRCHDFSMTVQSLRDFFILNVRGADYRVYMVGVDRNYALYVLNNSDLSNKGIS